MSATKAIILVGGGSKGESLDVSRFLELLWVD